MSASIHDKLNRVRKPRVHITYEVETEGAQVERNCPSWWACWAISPAIPTKPLKPLNDRKFVQIDRDNFNDVMARMTRAEPQGGEHAQGRRQRDGRATEVQLDGRLRAGHVVEQVRPLRKLLETRNKLRDLLTRWTAPRSWKTCWNRCCRTTSELKKALGPSWAIEQRRRSDP